MNKPEPPIVSVIGRKNSGKTTLVVAVAAALKARGVRVASMKHGHHDFEIDHSGRDSWRHMHEGGVEAVIMASARKVALVMHTDEAERDPRGLVRRFFAGQGYDLVLVEGFKHGPFPKIEIFRAAVHEHPVYGEAEHDTGAPHLAIVTDAPESLSVPVPVIALQSDGSHVAAVADLIFAYIRATQGTG